MSFSIRKRVNSLDRAGGLGGVRGANQVGHATNRGTGVVSEKYKGMSPAWHKEHEKAFELAQNEGMKHFKRCPKCKKYVCENDWN